MMLASPQSYDHGDWGTLLERVGTGNISAAEAIQISEFALQQTNANPCWSLPLAFGFWILNDYQKVFDILTDKKVESVCAFNVCYFTLLGMSARQLHGKRELAISCYQKALNLDPDRTDVLYNYANLIKEDEPVNAISLYERALLHNPMVPECWHNYGSTLNVILDFESGIRALRLSLCIQPDVPDVWCNLGISYYGLDRFEEAERCFRKAISLDSSHAQSHLNLGNTLLSVLQPEEAIQVLERGVALEASSTNSLWNLSLAYLSLGNFLKGWHYYESRFSNKDFEHVKVPTSGKQIRSLDCLVDLQNYDLVVWSEQGLGDTIQFCRYLYLLESAGISFVFLTRPPLLGLMRNWLPFSTRIECLGSTNPPEDLRPHVSLMSLPMVFKTEVHSIPSHTPYLAPSTPMPDHLRLEPPSGAISVGLVWASNPDNKQMYRNKSIPLKMLMTVIAPLVSLDLIQLHSLQYGDDSDQMNPWISSLNVKMWNHVSRDFSDSAHIISQLDLIISVDTAVAHLAGALNRPVWLLLPLNCDFRWMRNRPDSPWYPSMRIFRQAKHGEWSTVVQDLEVALQSLFMIDFANLSAAINQ